MPHVANESVSSSVVRHCQIRNPHVFMSVTGFDFWLTLIVCRTSELHSEGELNWTTTKSFHLVVGWHSFKTTTDYWLILSQGSILIICWINALFISWRRRWLEERAACDQISQITVQKYNFIISISDLGDTGVMCLTMKVFAGCFLWSPAATDLLVAKATVNKHTDNQQLLNTTSWPELCAAAENDDRGQL